jgi:hypothetical protein
MRDGWLRLAELTSSIGAGVLDFGLGLLLVRSPPNSGVPVLLVGLGLHVWGMFDKHRLESGVVDGFIATFVGSAPCSSSVGRGSGFPK